MASTFKLDLTKFAEKTKGRTDLVLRRFAFDLFKRVVVKTPVDTGRAKANWIAAVGTLPTETVDEFDKSRDGKATQEKIRAAVSGFGAGKVIFLANNLPYIRKLEYGNWSQQAPQGMVGVSVVEVRNIINTALGGGTI